MVDSFFSFCKQNKIIFRYLMMQPGKILRQTRERLCLKYRDVEEASQRLADRHKNSEYIVGLSRLADIENKGTVPSIFKIFALAVIYGMDYGSVLSLYGISLEGMASDMTELNLKISRPIELKRKAKELTPASTNRDVAFDHRHTSFISNQIEEWGEVPLQIAQGMDSLKKRFAFVGSEDWSMYPLIPPGSFVQIDENKRRVANSGWENEYTRPIYFLLLHEGYRFAWCTERAGMLIVQPHSAAQIAASAYKYPGEVEVLGQAVGVAMRLDRERPHRKRSS